MALRRLTSLLGTLFVLALTAACIAALYNVFRDDSYVLLLAQETACAGVGDACNPQKQYVERGPLAETFEFLTSKGEVVRVRCARKDVLFGDYACEVRDFHPFVVPTFTVAHPAASAKGGRARPAGARGLPAAHDGGT